MTHNAANPAVPSHAHQPDVLTHDELKQLGLYTWLAQVTGRGVSRLNRDIFRSHQDPRRLFTSKQRREIIARDFSCCRYCGKHVSGDAGDRVYIDHVIPWVLGGQTVLDNGVVACSTCNSSKGAKVW